MATLPERPEPQPLTLEEALTLSLLAGKLEAYARHTMGVYVPLTAGVVLTVPAAVCEVCEYFAELAQALPFHCGTNEAYNEGEREHLTPQPHPEVEPAGAFYFPTFNGGFTVTTQPSAFGGKRRFASIEGVWSER